MVTRSETRTITIPLHIWGRLASEADQRNMPIAELLVRTIEQLVVPRPRREERVIELARKGLSDDEICEQTGETRAYVAEKRRSAGIRRRARKAHKRGEGNMRQETVRVYTKPDCKQCDLTKAALTRAGIPFEVEDLTDEGNLNAAKSLGFSSAPVVIVGEEGWAGFRPDKIAELVERIEGAG